MPVGTFTQTDFETQGGTEYKTNIDNNFSALNARMAGYAPHEQATPDMTVRVDSGTIFNQSTGVLTVNSIQNTATITQPASGSGFLRRDILHINPSSSGLLAVTTGSEQATPIDPTIPTDVIPIARIRLPNSLTAITNTIIDDLRSALYVPAGTITKASQVQAETGSEDTTYMTPLKTTQWGDANALWKYARPVTYTASHTIISSDAARVLQFNVGSNHTLSLPKNATTSLGDGFQFTVAQIGSGNIIFAVPSGESFFSYGSADRTAGKYALAAIWRPSSGQWFAGGHIVASGATG